ncbi:leucine-rich PPR motif-containing protein, mitochondrial-like [Uloborus diversus]|uniref:leucine-rich PPR motif-containing protein, mitochondrial-like n=1 Tax=Uloborus diversus TaxID=327109 RepID=UPI00240A23FA|nr:leucine-rich PPR motif-containing protein, mitochondrial-like [Uloborus diversus]
MAAVFGKNVKLPNAQARCMLLLTGVKSSSPHLKKTFPLVYANQNKFLSTAAQKLVVNDDLVQKKSLFPEPSKLDGKLSDNIDKALADIDTYVRRTGRVFKQNVEGVFCMVKDAGSISSTQGLYLLRCCERMIDELPEQRIRLADEVWQMLQSYGVQFEVAHYNSRLRLYVENGHDFSPGEILAAMENQGIEPNKVTYRYLMEKCCADGNLTAASEILEFLKTKDIPVDENIFNALIKGYINSGDFEGAENILEVMKSSNLAPNADSYTALACGYAKKGDLQRMKDHMRGQNRVNLTNKHLLEIIDALAVSGHLEAIDEIMSSMGDGNVYRQDFINAAVNLVHKNLDDVAYKLVLAASGPNFNTGTNIFLKQMLKSRRPIESIIKYSDEIFKRGLNDIILLNVAKAAIDYEMMGVLMTLKKMAEFGILPDFTVYRHRVLPALGIFNAQDFIAKLEQEKLPTAAALDALFDFYCSLGRSDLASNLLESNSIQVNPNFDLKGYVSAFRKSDVDPMAYFKVLKFVIENVGSYLLEKDQEAFQGRFLAELIRLDPALFDMFQKKMDCSLSQKSLQICQEDLRKKAPQLLTHLRKLEKTETDMSEEDEEKHLAALKDQGLPTKFFLADRLMYYIKKRNIDKVDEIRTRLEGEGFEFSNAQCAQLIGVYSEAKNFDVVQDLMQKMKKINPGFRLDIVKAIEYASLLVKYEKYDGK